MKVHRLSKDSGVISGMFAVCGVVNPKNWNRYDYRPGVTCRRCLSRRPRKTAKKEGSRGT